MRKAQIISCLVFFFIFCIAFPLGKDIADYVGGEYYFGYIFGFMSFATWAVLSGFYPIQKGGQDDKEH